jgi:hypothetical protein
MFVVRVPQPWYTPLFALPQVIVTATAVSASTTPQINIAGLAMVHLQQGNHVVTTIAAFRTSALMEFVLV